MRHALVVLTLCCIALAAHAQGRRAGGAPEALADPNARVLVATVHTRSDRGRVFCGLWRGPEGFPTDQSRRVGRAMDRRIVHRRAVCRFAGVTPGEYAMAVFHDENGNNDLDRNLFGIPSEGTGASNDAHNAFGPPAYEDARFTYPDTRMYRIVVHIHY